MDMNKRLAVDILVWVLLAATVATVTKAQVLAKPGCPSHCGNVSIPYPFGTREGCYLNENFYINCGGSDNSTATLGYTSSVVNNISMEGRLQILSTVSRYCYNTSEPELESESELEYSLSVFNVSNTRNKLTAIGCDTVVEFIGVLGNKTYRGGCSATCDRIEELNDGACSGYGCCKIQIPFSLKNITISLSSSGFYEIVKDFNPCGYGFLVEENQFVFSVDYVRFIPENYMFPVSLDWVVGNETCKEAKKNTSNYTCHNGSECYEPVTGLGYLCKCLDGYQGNPYLPEGCLDIDECESILSLCDQNAECYNLPGSFKCVCRHGYEDDGSINGTGCTPICKAHGLPIENIALGAGISILVLILGASWLYWGLWQGKLVRQRERFFQQNGGIMLQQELSKDEGSIAARIFTEEELKKATDNYHEGRILGQGGQGTVYKGILQDRVVAIKKSISVAQSGVEQFINEVIVLSQINHRNVVKLLGCCLETEVPMLVYEFISNGTLYHHLHINPISASASARTSNSIPWATRLRIAAETAGALSYLHSAAYPPIIHRDVKSANILLDDYDTAKVADFGASRFLPSDQAQLATLVQGTLGYLDPEYFQTSLLTEKSDVYSFGVVLAELLTGRKALRFELPEEERNLAMHFVSSMDKDQLVDIVDGHVLVDENMEQLKGVAMLAKKCLMVRGEERPTMKEVAMELEGLIKHPSSKGKDCLVGEISEASTSTNPTGCN